MLSSATLENTVKNPGDKVVPLILRIELEKGNKHDHCGTNLPNSSQIEHIPVKHTAKHIYASFAWLKRKFADLADTK